MNTTVSFKGGTAKLVHGRWRFFPVWCPCISIPLTPEDINTQLRKENRPTLTQGIKPSTQTK